MLLTLAAAICLAPPHPNMDGPLPPKSTPPCPVCVCCAACPCQTAKTVAQADLVKSVASAVQSIQFNPPVMVKTWVRLVNEPGVEVYGCLGTDGVVSGIEARRYYPASTPVYAPRVYAPAAACANGRCPRP